MVLSFGQWPYGKTPVVVLSRNSISFPSNLPNTVLVRKMADIEVFVVGDTIILKLIQGLNPLFMS